MAISDSRVMLSETSFPLSFVSIKFTNVSLWSDWCQKCPHSPKHATQKCHPYTIILSFMAISLEMPVQLDYLSQTNLTEWNLKLTVYLTKGLRNKSIKLHLPGKVMHVQNESCLHFGRRKTQKCLHVAKYSVRDPSKIRRSNPFLSKFLI